VFGLSRFARHDRFAPEIGCSEGASDRATKKSVGAELLLTFKRSRSSPLGPLGADAGGTVERSRVKATAAAPAAASSASVRTDRPALLPTRDLSHVERRSGFGTFTPAIFFGTFCLAIDNPS
jgi:hypothetical protein